MQNVTDVLCDVCYGSPVEPQHSLSINSDVYDEY